MLLGCKLRDLRTLSFGLRQFPVVRSGCYPGFSAIQQSSLPALDTDKSLLDFATDVALGVRLVLANDRERRLGPLFARLLEAGKHIEPLGRKRTPFSYRRG